MSSSFSLPRRAQGPLRSISIRVGVAAACLALTTVLVYLERDGYRDGTGTPLTWLDALYYSTVTLSTTGYGDISPRDASIWVKLYTCFVMIVGDNDRRNLLLACDLNDFAPEPST